MATPKKAREFMEATEMAANYSTMIESILGNISLEQLSNGDEDGARITELQAKLCERLRTKILDHQMLLMSQLFSDEELDEIIEIYNRPVSKKQREHAPVMMSDMLASFTDGRIDVTSIANQLMRETK